MLSDKEKRNHMKQSFPKPNDEEIKFLQTKVLEIREFSVWNMLEGITGKTIKEIMYYDVLLSSFAMDCVLTLIRQRVSNSIIVRNLQPNDFLHTTFLDEVAHAHPTLVQKKKLVLEKGRIPNVDRYVKSKRLWYTEVEELYNTYKIEDTHWVGICINLSEHGSKFLIATRILYPDDKLAKLIEPIVETLPHFIKKFAYNDNMKIDPKEKFQMKYPNNVCQTPDAGFSGIVAAMLSELHAGVKMILNGVISETFVLDAALKYSFEIVKTMDYPAS